MLKIVITISLLAPLTLANARPCIKRSSLHVSPEPCQAFTEDAEYVNFTLVMELERRDVSMQVPRVFLEDRWKQQNGARHTAILFRTMIDGFEPVTRAETPYLDFEYTPFLVKDYIDLPRLAELYLDSASPGVASPRQSLSEYATHSYRYGLEEIIPNYPDDLQANVYLHKVQSGAIDTVLYCKTPEAAQFPTCQQFFRTTTNVDIKFHYPVRFLPIWAKMQSNINAFVECAVTLNKQ